MRPFTERPPFSSSNLRLVLLTALLLLAACESDSGAPAAGDERVSGAETAAAPGSTQPTPSSCVAGYADKPCELLTAALVREHVPSLPSDAESEDIGAMMEERGIKAPKVGDVVYNGCSYSWDGGRKTPPAPAGEAEGEGEEGDPFASALDALKYNRPIQDTVEFKSIRLLEVDDPRAYFERKWSAPTDAERETLAQQMDEQMEEARQAGELSDSAAAAGSDLGRSMAFAAIEFEPVEGVGTVARWGGVGSERSLKVLDGATEFRIVADISDDESVNREAAVGIARAVLAQARSACR